MRLPDGFVDLESGMVRRADVQHHLTKVELAALRVLAAHQPEPVDQQTLLREAWTYDEQVRSRTVAVTMRRLRQKLEVDPGAPVFLVTVRRGGYAVRPVATDDPATVLTAERSRVGLCALGPEIVEQLVQICGSEILALQAAARLADLTPPPSDLLDSEDSTGNTARRALAVQVASLTPAARMVLCALTALGARPSTDELAEVCRCARQEVLGALESLSRARLVGPDGVSPLVTCWVREAPTIAETLAHVRRGVVAYLVSIGDAPTVLRSYRGSLSNALEHATGMDLLALLERQQELLALYGPSSEIPRVTDDVLARLEPSVLIEATAARLFSQVNCNVTRPWVTPVKQLIEQIRSPHRRGFARALLAAQRSVEGQAVSEDTLDLAIAETADGPTATALDVKIMAAMVYRDAGESARAAAIYAEVQEQGSTCPSRRLVACYRHANIVRSEESFQQLRYLLEHDPDGPLSFQWSLAAGWLGVALLKEGERGEGLQWLRRCLPSLTRLDAVFAQQIQVKAALCLLDDPDAALAMLPDSDQGHPTGRAITRWVRTVLVEPDARDGIRNPELLTLAAAYLDRSELPEAPPGTRYGIVWWAVREALKR